MTPTEERSTVERRWGKNAKRPWGSKGRLEIDRSKSAVANHESRGGEARPRESVWNLRNPNGGESYAEATDAEAKNRIRRKNGVVCDVEHHDGGVVGKRTTEEIIGAMRNNGKIDISNPTYGYLRVAKSFAIGWINVFTMSGYNAI